MNRLTQHKASQNVLMRLHTIYSLKYLNMKLLTILGAITTPFQIRKSNIRPHDNRRHKAGTKLPTQSRNSSPTQSRS